MKGSRKGAPPQELTQERLDHWEKDRELRSKKVRKNKSRKARKTQKMLIHALLKEQRGLCVYCGRRRKKKPEKDKVTGQDGPAIRQVEHFRPRSKRPDLAADYSNLFVSCGHEEPDGTSTQTCGNKKGDRFCEDQHVLPVYPDCTQRFRFLDDGTIEPKDPHDTAAQKMLDILNLNDDELVMERKELFLKMDESKLEWKDLMLDIPNLNDDELVMEWEELFQEIDESRLELKELWNAKKGKADSYAHAAYERAGKVLP